MPSTLDWKPSDPFQGLIYGTFKVGKSFGAFSFPRPVVFDFDQGIATSRSSAFVAKYGLRDIKYEQFPETGKRVKGVLSAHNAFDDACRYFDEWMKPAGKWTSKLDGKTYDTGKDLFDTFIIDSGTTLIEKASTKAIIVLGAFDKPLSFTQKQAVDTGVVNLKQQDYGSERSLTEQFIQMVKESGKNVILCCHEKSEQNDAGTVTAIMPLLTGQSVERVCLKFDEIYRLTEEKIGPNVVRSLTTAKKTCERVGSRYGVPTGTQWDYEELMKVLKEIKAKQLSVLPGPTGQGIPAVATATVPSFGGPSSGRKP